MKLLVFAHTPPPYHGQSYAVQNMLNGFGGDHRKKLDKTTIGSADSFGIECYHVNARLSRDVQDIGEFRGGKLFALFRFCLQALWCRFRYGVTTFYYVPAPGKYAPLYRDWLVMLLCRPFFKKIILHWHAAGLPEWLETNASTFLRNVTYSLMKNADLSIVLSEFNRRDAEKFDARRIAVVSAGVSDPCPHFEQDILTFRRERVAARKKILLGAAGDADKDITFIQVLFLALCTREKGVFDAVEGVALANEKLAAEKSLLRLKLTLIGAFVSGSEEKELRELIQRRGLQNTVECLGFISEERKANAFANADFFCFPTYYHAESFGAVILEAMAFGLPIITTRWRSIPEILPLDYPGFVDPRSPGQIADALHRMLAMDLTEKLREIFVHRFTLKCHLTNLAEAIHSVETPIPRSDWNVAMPIQRSEQSDNTLPLKLLVFAHVPPPHHGQSYMVQLMLTGFGGDQRHSPAVRGTAPYNIACYHVNARVSKKLEDIGNVQLGKVILLLGYCLQAIWCRFRYDVKSLYYVPAPGKRSAIYRDWIVMLLCRPFFKHTILHWHAAGLGSWLTTSALPFTRTVTHLSLGRPSLSIIISDFNRADAEQLQSRAIARVDYGIVNPCPDFAKTLLQQRTNRSEVFRRCLTATSKEFPGPSPTFTVLFLANCLRTKGIFDALEAFLQLRERIQREDRPLHVRFRVGGAFESTEDRYQFEQRIAESKASSDIKYLGFVSGERKDQELRLADLLCFPTYYSGENQPIVLIEALAYGLPAVTTAWRSIPDIFPPGYCGIVPPHDVPAIMNAIGRLMTFNEHASLHERFCDHFTAEAYLRKLAAAIRSI